MASKFEEFQKQYSEEFTLDEKIAAHHFLCDSYEIAIALKSNIDEWLEELEEEEDIFDDEEDEEDDFEEEEEDLESFD